MKYLGLKDFYIRDLMLPPDLDERLKSPHVHELAKSLRTLQEMGAPGGTIHKPTVRAGTLELISGGDRLAAHVHNGWTNILADVWELMDEEVEVMRRTENAHRRHSAEEQRAETEKLVRAYMMKPAIKEKLELMRAERRRNGVRGRMPSKETMAMQLVAEETGAKVDTLRKRNQRKKAKEAEQAFEPEALAVDQPEPAAEIDLLGLQVDPQFLAGVKIIRLKVREMANHLMHVAKCATQMENSGAHLQVELWERLRNDFDKVADHIRGYSPASVCPYCKLVQVVQEECALCMSTGWISRTQESQVERRFFDTENPVVQFRGQTRPVSDFDSEDPFSALDEVQDADQ
jgi:ParB-like chromosome segregation protein Spo0J